VDDIIKFISCYRNKFDMDGCSGSLVIKLKKQRYVCPGHHVLYFKNTKADWFPLA
jgi:hypothetical protein